MTDRLTPEQRHKVMKNIHSSDTSIEVRLRKALWHEGIRYRKNLKGLPGTPDIAITRWKIAVFCDGSFWHLPDCVASVREAIMRAKCKESNLHAVRSAPIMKQDR